MKNPQPHSLRSLPTLAAVATLATAAGFLLHSSGTAGPEHVGDSTRELSRAFRDVARDISPSVVSVLAVHETPDSAMRGRALDSREGLGELWRFFDDDERSGQPFGQPLPPGQGTGVIVDADGILATNNHVVAGAHRIEVTLQDGRRLPAKVLGTDPETDLALLRVEAKGLPAAKLGDSTLLEPGDWVVAVGNPFGLDHTVTVGVVSAIGRSGLGIANPSYTDFIQTDAAINPGNSGGPLLNLDGEVIGINTAIRSSNGGSDGISFAIPSATLKRVLPQLVADGRVSRGWLGVTLQPLTDELARSFGAEGKRGTLISQVLGNTPASEAGLRAGDIVLSVGGKSAGSPRELSAEIAAFGPDTRVELEVLREGETVVVTVALGERPASDALVQRPMGRESERDGYGLRLTELPEALLRAEGLSGGALVREVEPGSPADKAGLRPGDVLLSVGSHELDSPEEGARLLRESDSSARLLVRAHDGSTRWVFLARGAGE
ncbi:MAG: Do family serine endopeptidase [Planctomycetes bacterium]|nr:Do family serine endopeptidase [Planctomycetota bacterium]